MGLGGGRGGRGGARRNPFTHGEHGRHRGNYENWKRLTVQSKAAAVYTLHRVFMCLCHQFLPNEVLREEKYCRCCLLCCACLFACSASSCYRGSAVDSR